jgi:hypothetical protein
LFGVGGREAGAKKKDNRNMGEALFQCVHVLRMENVKRCTNTNTISLGNLGEKYVLENC